jgi:hypothetical protein
MRAPMPWSELPNVQDATAVAVVVVALLLQLKKIKFYY